MESDSSEELCSSSSEDFESSSESSSESDGGDLRDARNWYRIDVKKFTPPPPRFPFSGNTGLKINLHSGSEPIDFFNNFFDDQVIEFIVNETNRFAHQFLEKYHLKEYSRVQNWIDTNVREMRVFLALILLQSIVQKPLEKWYWYRRPVIETPFFGRVMKEKRYALLMKFLHFSNNDTLDKNTHPNPKLSKMFYLIETLNAKFKASYIPERDISIDESLMPYKGRLSWKQFIATKRARFGIKLFRLCEATSGYIWNSVIYTGKGTVFDQQYEEYGLATKSVMSLIHDLLGKGYCLSIDNFYTSPQLVDLLIEKRTDVYGTVRPNRKDLPKEIKTEKIEKGEIMGFQRGKILALKWVDKKPICMLSTIHNLEMVNVEKRDKTVQKPVAVCAYNETMGGVDKADQCLSYYKCSRNQQRKYYKKMFRYFLDVTVWNACVLYNKTGGKLRHVDFRMELVEQLIEENCESVLSRSPMPSRSKNVLRFTERHFPSFVTNDGKKCNPVRRCVVCCAKVNEHGKKIRKETRYCCTQCDVGLCPAPCFEIYHSKEKY